MTIEIIRTGNIALVDTVDSFLIAQMSRELRFTEYVQLRGAELYQAKVQNRKPFKILEHVLYTEDLLGRLATGAGFIKKLKSVIEKNGHSVSVTWRNPHKAMSLAPNWGKIDHMEFRPKQREMLEKISESDMGIIDCNTGWGKTHIMMFLALLYPKAKILITTKRISVLMTIYNRMRDWLPDQVGLYGGGKKVVGKRVMCISSGSLSNADKDYDFVLGDEVHELASDSYVRQLTQFQDSRMYGFTATANMRADGKDKRLTGLFGPVIGRVPYSVTQDAKMVSPIRVKWRKVIATNEVLDAITYRSEVERSRQELWRNVDRNNAIKQDALSYPHDCQVLITVDTFEHLAYLLSILPDFIPVYRSAERKDIDRYIQNKILPDRNYPTNPDLDTLRKQFERNEIKKVIATSVWNVGVSFDNLEVLIRANGTSSKIASVQGAGRLSRLAEGKEYGTLHDYIDNHDSLLMRKSNKRYNTYVETGFKQVFKSREDHQLILSHARQ